MRACFRTRLFWFGLPGIAFLAWVWVDSVKTAHEVSCRWILFDHYAGIGLTSSPNRMGVWMGRPYIGIFGMPYSGVRWHRSSVSPDRTRIDKPGPWEARVEGMDRARVRVVFDSWFVITVYLGVWIGLTWWRVRRKVRLIRAVTPS